MSFKTNIKWIWPPNFDGNIPKTGGLRKVILNLTGRVAAEGDEVNETDVLKLDLSTLRRINGVAPTRTVVEKIDFSVGGFTNVLLSWDRAPNETIAVLSGQGQIKADIVDQGGDGTGNILLSTDGIEDGANYDITLCVRLK